MSNTFGELLSIYQARERTLGTKDSPPSARFGSVDLISVPGATFASNIPSEHFFSPTSAIAKPTDEPPWSPTFTTCDAESRLERVFGRCARSHSPLHPVSFVHAAKKEVMYLSRQFFESCTGLPWLRYTPYNLDLCAPYKEEVLHQALVQALSERLSISAHGTGRIEGYWRLEDLRNSMDLNSAVVFAQRFHDARKSLYKSYKDLLAQKAAADISAEERQCLDAYKSTAMASMYTLEAAQQVKKLPFDSLSDEQDAAALVVTWIASDQVRGDITKPVCDTDRTQSAVHRANLEGQVHVEQHGYGMVDQSHAAENVGVEGMSGRAVTNALAEETTACNTSDDLPDPSEWMGKDKDIYMFEDDGCLDDNQAPPYHAGAFDV